MKSKSTTKPAISKKIALAPEKNLDDLALLDTEGAKLKHKKAADQLLAETSSNKTHLAHAVGQQAKVVATSDQVDTEALADGDENHTISKSDLDFMTNQWESGQGNFLDDLQTNTVETASLSSDARFSKYIAPVAVGAAAIGVAIAASGNDDNNDNNDNSNTPKNCDHTLPDNTKLKTFLATTAGEGADVQVSSRGDDDDDISPDPTFIIQGGFQRSATGSAATALYDIADINLETGDTDFLSDLEGQLSSDGLHIELISDSEDASNVYVGAYSMALGDNTSDIIWLKDLTIFSDTNESADKALEYNGRIEIVASASGEHADAETAVGNVAIHLGNAERESEAQFYQNAYAGSGDSSAHTYVGDVEISASADEYRAFAEVRNYAEAYGDCSIAVSEFGTLTLNATHLNTVNADDHNDRYVETRVTLDSQAESEGAESYLLGGDVSAHVLATGALAADRDENYNFYGINSLNIESSADGVSANAVLDIGNVSMAFSGNRTDGDLVGVYADVDNRVGSRVGYLTAYAYEPGASASTTVKDLTLSASYDQSIGEIGGGVSTRAVGFTGDGEILYSDDRLESYVSAYALISDIRAIAESKDSTASITIGNVDLDATQSLSLAGMYNDTNDAYAYIKNYASAGLSQLLESAGDVSGIYIAAYGVDSAADLTMASLTINADTNLLIEGDITENSILTAYNNSYANIQYLASYLSGEGVSTQLELADVSLTATSNMSAVELTDDGAVAYSDGNVTLLGDLEDSADVTSTTYAGAYLGYLIADVRNGSDNVATTTLGDLSLAANASNNFGVINNAMLEAEVEAKATANEIYARVYGNDNTASLTLDSLDLDAHASFTVATIAGEDLHELEMTSYAWAYSDFIEAYAKGTNDSTTISIDGVIDIASSATFLNDGDNRDSGNFIYTLAYATLGEIYAEVYGNDTTATFKAGSVSVTAMSSQDAQNYYDGYAYSRSYSSAYSRGIEAATSEGSNNEASISIDGLNVSADTIINMGFAESMSMQTAGYSEAYVGQIAAYAWGESSNTALLTINGDLVVNATTIVNLSGDAEGISVIDSFEGGEAPHFTLGAYSEAYVMGIDASADAVESLVELSIDNIDITASSTLTAGDVVGESEVDYIVGAYAHMRDLKVNSYDDATARLTVLDVNVEALSSVDIGDISNGNVDPSLVKIGTDTSALINYMSAYSRQGGETSLDVGNISVTASNSVLFGAEEGNASFDLLFDPTADVLFNTFGAENQVEAIIHHMYAYAYTDATTTYTAGDITISATGLYGRSTASLNDMRSGAHEDGTSFMSVGNIDITASNEEEAIAQLDYLYAYAYTEPNPFGISYTSSAALETKNITIAATSQVGYAEARLEIRSEGQHEGAVASAIIDGNTSLSAISHSGDAQASLDINAVGNDNAIASVEVTGNISLSVDSSTDYVGFDLDLGISTFASGDSVTVGDISLTTAGDASSAIRVSINSVEDVNNIVIGNVDVSMENISSSGNIEIDGVAWDMDRTLTVSGGRDILVDLGSDQTGDNATQVFGTIDLDDLAGNVSIDFADADKDVTLTTQTGAAIATAGIDFTVINGFDGDLNNIRFDGIDQVGNIDWGNTSTETAVADLWSDLLSTLDTNEYAFTLFEETGNIDLDGDGNLLETMGVLAFDSNTLGISNIVFIDNEPEQYSVSPLIVG